jgi:sporulation protein YlmC with PRC-barrel domain
MRSPKRSSARKDHVQLDGAVSRNRLAMPVLQTGMPVASQSSSLRKAFTSVTREVRKRHAIHLGDRVMHRSLTGFAITLAAMGFLAAQSGAADKVITNNTATAAHHCRASKIEDMKVRNAAGEDIGKIKDLVIDVNSGKIVYAALDFGGFLGIGDKLFAVPWHALAVSNAKDSKEHVLVLDVAKDKLKNAPGFDKDHWPDMANPTWSTEVDRFYGPAGTAAR